MAPGQPLVGPNAAIQLAIALRSAGLNYIARDVFAKVGAQEWLERPPTAMVDEMRVARIHQGIREKLSREDAGAILAAAGQLTADYLLANRIPKAFRRLLSYLPRSVAERLFLSALRRHAWTFVGSGKFIARMGAPTILEIKGNPFCEGEKRTAPVCDWHAAVFQRMFASLSRPLHKSGRSPARRRETDAAASRSDGSVNQRRLKPVTNAASLCRAACRETSDERRRYF